MWGLRSFNIFHIFTPSRRFKFIYQNLSSKQVRTVHRFTPVHWTLTVGLLWRKASHVSVVSKVLGFMINIFWSPAIRVSSPVKNFLCLTRCGSQILNLSMRIKLSNVSLYKLITLIAITPTRENSLNLTLDTD